MKDNTELTILCRISGKDVETLEIEEPYGIIKDTTYTGDCYLVEWPDEDSP